MLRIGRWRSSDTRMVVSNCISEGVSCSMVVPVAFRRDVLLPYVHIRMA
jgi:hypothetical protein